MAQNAQPPRWKQFWRQRVADVIVAQFTQGFTPQKIALTISLGFNLGLFPILGVTTVLCAAAGLWLRLNQPVIQLVNWLAAPLQLAMMLVFVRAGEWMTQAQRVSFSLPELIHKFHESPVGFFREFGISGLHGIIAWLAVAPVLTAVIYFILLPLLKKLAQIKTKNAR